MTGSVSVVSPSELTAAYRVRFDECGPDGLVRTSALLRYAQDVAWIHSERLGFDRRWYADRGLAWLVRAAQVVVLRPVGLGTRLAVTTRVTGFRKVWARRRTEARLEDGSPAMWGQTDWVMTGADGAPARVPEEFPARFPAPLGTFVPGRVPLPPAPPDAVRIGCTVRPQDLDPMGHANNAAYVDYLEEALLAAAGRAEGAARALPRRVRIEYLLPAPADAILESSTWPVRDEDERDSWAWRLGDPDGRDVARGRLTPGAEETT